MSRSGKLAENLKTTHQFVENKMNNLIPALYCRHGVSLSVQASDFHYCTPKANIGPYTHVEIGYIELNGERYCPPEFEKYQEPVSKSIYCFVPIELVEAFIFSNGGLSNDLNNYLRKV